MRNILILLYLGYVCSDKLDLTYLPPPGSEYAGGRPDDIQTPLEFPKKTYSSTRRPPGTEFSQGIANPTDYEATIGINRVPPRPDYRPATPVSNVQSTFGVPTTTVSYAFTQTTTHPPTESYETTINPITGVPTFNNFNTASQEPGFNENKSTQYYPTIPGSTSAANFYEGAQKLPGRENINQNGYQSSYSTTPTSATKFPVGDFSSNLSGQNYGDRTAPSLFQNSQQTYPDRDSAISFAPNQYNLNNSSLGNFINRPGFVSSTTTQHSPTGLRESLAGIENNQKPSDSPYQNQYEQDFNQNKYSDQSEIPNQQFSGTYANDKGTSELPTKDSSKARLPFSPGFSSKQLPAKQQPGFNRYDTKPSDPKYTGPNNFGNIDSTIYRPPRPQAEADRNAVILNYENVLTPEGFAYTFDTSNGIHADESGTAVDGVKAKGSFSYTGDDGNVYSIVYTADENGFQPHGEHLPTPPPIPEAIQRIIEKVKQEKEAGIFDDGTYDEDKYGYKKYQGDKGYHPKDSAINYDNVDFENKNRYNLPSRTQIGSKKPSAVDSNTIYDKTVQPTSQSDFEHQVISSDKGRPSEYTNTDAVVTLKGRKPNINNLKDISNEPFINRIPSRRPSVEIDSQYEVDDNNRRLSGQYPDHGNEHYYKGVTKYDGDDKRKGAHDNGVKLIHDNEDIRNEDTKGLNEPIEYVGKHNQGAFDNYSGSKTSSERPSKPSYEDAYKYDEANEYHREEAPGLKTSSRYPSKSEYGDNRITSQSPSGSRTKPSKKVSSFDQTLTKTRRPNRPGLRVNDDEEFVDYIDSTKVQDNSQINDYLGTTPYYGAYEDEDKVTSDVPQIYSTKYAATQDEYPETTDEYDHYIDENSKNQYGVRLSSKPVFNPSTGIVEYIERNVNKTGYQYIPPRTKFDEINKLPERLSTTKRPSQQTYYTEESTGRPFVTPGGKLVTYKTPDGEYFERDGTIVKYPSQNQGRPNVNINTGNSPDQIFTKEIVSTPQLPITPTSPSYSSTYQTQTPGFQNKFEAALKPSEPGAKFGTRRPYDGVSSTTPPSRRPVFYDSTQTAITPGQQNLYYSETTRKPGAFSSSTIPTSTQGPAAEEYSPDGNKYSTYRTMEPVNPTNDYRAEITASRLPTAGPTKGPNTVETVKYGSRLPSTTYRPNYTIVAKGESPTARPGTVVDRYGRPIPTLVSQGFNKHYPGEETNDYVNNKPGRPQYGLNGEITPTGYQTSTQRIIGEDFSGPKQQQKFDPKTGYYY